MGRKPNALITEFFVRGRKLQDSSNRYHMTCKACHQEFPKGRIDGLYHHLIKKCAGISREQRERVTRLVNAGRSEDGEHVSGLGSRHAAGTFKSRDGNISKEGAVAMTIGGGHRLKVDHSRVTGSSSPGTTMPNLDTGINRPPTKELQHAPLLPISKPICTSSTTSAAPSSHNTVNIEITEGLLSNVKPISWILPWGSSEVLLKPDN